jgi:phosphoadenosine phosphosulfate reductase
VKISPLVDWTWGDVWHFIATHALPYNALHDRFFPSIGCEPCTRAISVGEDFRAGRWWWEQEGAKECGLHVQSLSDRTELVDVPGNTTSVLRQAQDERSLS